MILCIEGTPEMASKQAKTGCDEIKVEIFAWGESIEVARLLGELISPHEQLAGTRAHHSTTIPPISDT